jgi:hypothetical protein
MDEGGDDSTTMDRRSKSSSVVGSASPRRRAATTTGRKDWRLQRDDPMFNGPASSSVQVFSDGNGNGNGNGGALPRRDSDVQASDIDDVAAAESAPPPPPPLLLGAEQDVGHAMSVERTVHARIEDVWAVLTDYNKLQEFIPNLVRPRMQLPSTLYTAPATHHWLITRTSVLAPSRRCFQPAHCLSNVERPTSRVVTQHHCAGVGPIAQRTVDVECRRM